MYDPCDALRDYFILKGHSELSAYREANKVAGRFNPLEKDDDEPAQAVSGGLQQDPLMDDRDSPGATDWPTKAQVQAYYERTGITSFSKWMEQG